MTPFRDLFRSILFEIYGFSLKIVCFFRGHKPKEGQEYRDYFYPECARCLEEVDRDHFVWPK